MSSSHEIDFEDLEKLTLRLGEALRDHKAEPENLYILDSAIKRFELTYLLTIKLMQRYLQEFAPVQLESDMTFRELIESAREQGVTSLPFEDWVGFRKARNQTAHTYQEDVARELVGEAAAFLPQALSVLQAVKERLGRDEQLEND